MTTATLLGKAVRTADQVKAEADKLDPVKILLVLLVIPFVAVGWTARMVVRAAWVVLSWMWGAVLVGWRSAGGEGKPG